MIDGIIFDKDGTLFDFDATWGSWAREMIRAEAAGDGALAQALAAAIVFDLERGVFLPESPAIAGTPDEMEALLRPVLPPERREGLLARLDASAQEAPLRPVCDLAALMADLRARGYALGVVTNDSEAPTHAHLRAVGVGDAFDFIAGYDSGHGAKPGPGPCLAFAEALGLAPGRCAMVGDSLTDLGAARAAGMRGVGVLTGPAPEAELAPHAEVVLPSIAALPAWLEQIRG